MVSFINIEIMEIEIARIHPDARLPEYKTDGAACFDIEAIEETVINPGEVVRVRTGLVIKTPKGMLLAVAPRSSTFKAGIDFPNSFGIFDPDYCGPEDELTPLVRNFTNKPVTIEKHQRIAQAFLVEIPRVIWREVEKSELGEKSRGGVGSTGHK